MANRFFQQFLFSFIHKPVKLWGTIVVGSTGAVTSYCGTGITSVTKESGNGTYTILLDDTYAALLGMQVITKHATTGTDLTFQILAETVATTKTVVLGVVTSGTLANADSGDVLYFSIELRNSSVTK